MSQVTSDVERIAESYLGIWNDREYELIPDVGAESFEMHDPAAPGGEVYGPNGLESFIRAVVTGFSDFHDAPIDMLPGDDTVITENEYTMTDDG